MSSALLSGINSVNISNVKNRWIFVTLGLVGILGLGTSVFFLLKPKPIQKIKLSSFQNAETVARSIVLRLNQEIKQTPAFLLGLNPLEVFHQQVLEELKKILQQPDYSFQILSQSAIDFDPNQFIKDAERAKQEGKKIFTTATFVKASHLREDWPGNNYLTVSLYPLPRSRFQEPQSSLQQQCAGEEATPGKDVGCLALGEARKNYSKSMDSSQWTGIMNQVGVWDYLFLLGKEAQ